MLAAIRSRSLILEWDTRVSYFGHPTEIHCSSHSTKSDDANIKSIIKAWNAHDLQKYNFYNIANDEKCPYNKNLSSLIGAYKRCRIEDMLALEVTKFDASVQYILFFKNFLGAHRIYELVCDMNTGT